MLASQVKWDSMVLAKNNGERCLTDMSGPVGQELQFYVNTGCNVTFMQRQTQAKSVVVDMESKKKPGAGILFYLGDRVLLLFNIRWAQIEPGSTQHRNP